MSNANGCLVCVSVTLHGSATVPHTDAGRTKSWPVRGHETTLGAHVWTLTHATVDETQMTTERQRQFVRRMSSLMYSWCSTSETQASALLLSQMCSNLDPLRHRVRLRRHRIKRQQREVHLRRCAVQQKNDHLLLQDRSNRREPVFQLR